MPFRQTVAEILKGKYSLLFLFIFSEASLTFLLWAVSGFLKNLRFGISSLMGRVLVPLIYTAVISAINSKWKSGTKKNILIDAVGTTAFLFFLFISGEISTKRNCQEDGDCSDFKFLEIDLLLHSLCFMMIIHRLSHSRLFFLFTSALCIGYSSFRFIDYSGTCIKETLLRVVSRTFVLFLLGVVFTHRTKPAKPKGKSLTSGVFKEMFHQSDDFLLLVEKKSLRVIEVNQKTTEVFKEAWKNKDFLKYFLVSSFEPTKAESPQRLILRVPSDAEKFNFIKQETGSKSDIKLGHKTLLSILKEMQICSCSNGNSVKQCLIHQPKETKPQKTIKEERTFEAVLLFPEEDEMKNGSFRIKVKPSGNERWFLVSVKQENEKMVWENATKVMNQVCHDIRNPASSIEILCKKAKGELGIEEKFKKKYFSTIKTSAMIIQVLAEDLLDVFLMKQGKFKLRSQVLSFRKVIGLAKKITEVQMGEKDVKVLVKISRNVPETIKTDKDRFFQIVLNLLSNARKFTEKGVITIKIKKDAEKENVYKVSICDTGTGMSPEFLKIIGNEGVREESATSTSLNPKGIGLGLNLCKKLALLIGPGTQGLMVSSKLKEGSKFSFFVTDTSMVVSQISHQSKIQAKLQKSQKGRSSPSNKSNFGQNNSNLWSSNTAQNPQPPNNNLLNTNINTDINQHGTSFDFADDEKDESLAEVAHEDVLYVNDPQNNILLSGSFLQLNIQESNPKETNFMESRVPNFFTPHSHVRNEPSEPKRPGKILRIQTIKKKEELQKQFSQDHRVFILLADDDNFNLVFLEEQLKKLDRESFKIKKARNGQIAWEEFKKFSESEKKDMPAVIFLDNQMPLMKGAEVAQKITKHCEHMGKVPPFLILVSGDQSDEKTLNHFDFSLSKPINKTELRAVMVDMDILPETRQD